MRACEFITEYQRTPFKGVSLKTINNWKQAHRERLRAEEKRKPLIAAMYKRPIDHEAALNDIELQRERIELAKDYEEFKQLKMKRSKDSYEAIQQMARSEIKRRKKT